MIQGMMEEIKRMNKRQVILFICWNSSFIKIAVVMLVFYTSMFSYVTVYLPSSKLRYDRFIGINVMERFNGADR